MNKLFRICLQTTLVILACKLVYPVNGDEANLLDNYIPAAMQALAYYIDLLQYEPVATTTVEPPFFAEGEIEERTTASPLTTTSTKPTTKKPTSSWFQSPSWWSSTTQAPGSTTTTVKPLPTHKHKPGLYAPNSAETNYSNRDKNSQKESDTPTELEPSQKFPFNTDAAFIRWLRGQKPRQDNIDEAENSDNFLDFLPLSLKQLIDQEPDEQDQRTGIENLDNFLRNYDDRYGNYGLRSPITGKKRIPPTKTYVDFLLTYDLLKRDAKAANLSKYEGYSEKMIVELYELSSASAQRQLYTIFKRMLDRKEIQRSDVVTRAQKLVKELGDGKSVISVSLMYFPPLQFLP